MFRKRNRQAAAPQEAEQVPTQAPATSGMYQSYELTTFDGKGHPVVMVYTRDAEGRTIKTVKRMRRAER
ncbi:MAG TPA: hypothetical protein VHG90_09760 [Acidimicrobiales bacterium]|nr:hypothetical protein [Acidimicrobiales bacterium]